MSRPSRKTKIQAIGTLLLTISSLPSYSSDQQQHPSLVHISTKNNSLILDLDSQTGGVYLLYYGRKVTDTKPFETKDHRDILYPAFGSVITDAACRITHADGNHTSELKFLELSEKTESENSKVYSLRFEDAYYATELILHFRTFENEDIIEQWSEVNNHEQGDIIVHEMASSYLNFRASSYFLSYFGGNWANEFNQFENELKSGSFLLQSNEAVRTTQKLNPSFLLSLDGKLQEDQGNAIGATLAWPGNWKIQFSVDDGHQLRVWSGMNPYASAYHLASGQTLTSPPLLSTFSSNGSGDITRQFHRWARNYGMHQGNGDRDVLLNNWEATGMDFDEQKLTALLHDAHVYGFDLFLLDDGWFGNKYPRNNDQMGLGDWEVNKKKLPNGLEHLLKEAGNNQVKFGLWVEPEMVNPKSELFEKHPEWALTAPHRELDLQRNQLVLDLTNPEVQGYILSMLNGLVKKYPQITYLKWDCNRFLTNAWSSYLPKDKQDNLYIDYANALLHILSQFRVAHPELTLMLCASGGGRMDYGSLKYFDEYWPSDNTDPRNRIKIQWGTNYFFPSIGMASHVSKMGDHFSLKFRLDVAMSGKLGMDLDPSKLMASEKETLKKAIAEYKTFKDIVLHGDLYRLISPYESTRAALMYESEDKARSIVFVYTLQLPKANDPSKLLLKGLDPDALYKISEINKGSFSQLEAYEGKTLSGAQLMSEGIDLNIPNEHESVVFSLEKL